MPVRFRRQHTTITVSPNNPLPVSVANSENQPVPTEESRIDLLLTGEVTCDGTAKDLLGVTATEAATIQNARPYRRFILMFWNPGGVTPQFTLLGRPTDIDGNPLFTSWFNYGTFTASGSTAGWYRIVLQTSDGTPLGADMYRIEVTDSATPPGSATLIFNLKGER
ncbi:hypothetical protein HRbin15_01742 [bacterium HR15]|nr:hypothetical protein HRbin15_01742 [bacterium HR15]